MEPHGKWRNCCLVDCWRVDLKGHLSQIQGLYCDLSVRVLVHVRVQKQKQPWGLKEDEGE